MDEIIVTLISDSVGWGVTVLVLVGLYRLSGRFMTINEGFLKGLVDQLERIADEFERLNET